MEKTSKKPFYRRLGNMVTWQETIIAGVVRFYITQTPPCSLQKTQVQVLLSATFLWFKGCLRTWNEKANDKPTTSLLGEGKSDSYENGKELQSLQWRKTFPGSSTAPMAEPLMHCLPNREHFREGSGSTAQQPWAFPFRLGSSLLTREKRAAHKMWIEDGLTGIPSDDKASWLHPFDRPSFSAYHAKSKYPSVNWRTCSISDLIVLNIASSLQINGNISHVPMEFLGVYEAVRYCCICNR